MAHDLCTVTGKAGYVGREAAWHQLGQVTGKYQNTAELLNDPIFAYRIFKSQLRDGLNRLIDAYGTFRIPLAHTYQDGIVRPEDAIFLGTVGKDYEVIQHAEGFRTIDALMNTVDGAHYETAGVLGMGERVWALADLKLSMSIGADEYEVYLLFATGHDGSMSHVLKIVFTRVVCANTFAIALKEKSTTFAVRHTKNAMARVQNANTAIAGLKDSVLSVEEKLKYLTSRKVNRESVVTVMDRLFPKVKGDDGESKDTTRRENIIGSILALYESNDGNAFPEQRGSAYNLLNAITNYMDHERTARGDKRAESAMFGTGDVLKSKAFEYILEGARNMDAMPSRQGYQVSSFAELGLNVVMPETVAV